MPDLIRHPCSPATQLFDSLWCVSKPGLGPAADLHFFVSPKKPKEKKGDPAVCVPALRSGQPAVLVKSGVSLELGVASDNREP